MPVRPYERETGWALPASLDAWIGPDHAVRFVASFIDGLTAQDWQEMGIVLEGTTLGAPSYHARLLVGIWLWGFMQGTRSSRHLEAACREQLSYLWLTGRQCPDHNTLWRFYQAHRQGMRWLFRHTVRTAVRLELVDLALQAVDGTKVQGNAAKERTYDRAGLARLEARIDQAIADLEAQNQSDGDPPSPRLPKDLQRLEDLRTRIATAREHLGEDEQRRINLSDADARLMPSRHGYVAGYNAQAMVSPLQASPPETQGGMAAPAATGMLMTAALVSTRIDDHAHLIPMLEAAEETVGARAECTVADGGFHSGAVLAACAERTQEVLMPESQHASALSGARTPRTPRPYGREVFAHDAASDTYTCPEGMTLSRRGTKTRTDRPAVWVYQGDPARCRACPAFGCCTRDGHHGRVLEVMVEYEAVLAAHRQRMATPEAKARYGRRKELVEPVFGILKEQLGLRRFLLRGREAVEAEWTLLATAFNLRVLARLWQANPARCAI